MTRYQTSSLSVQRSVTNLALLQALSPPLGSPFVSSRMIQPPAAVRASARCTFHMHCAREYSVSLQIHAAAILFKNSVPFQQAVPILYSTQIFQLVKELVIEFNSWKKQRKILSIPPRPIQHEDRRNMLSYLFLLFMYGLLNDALKLSGYIAQNFRVVGEKGVRIYVEGIIVIIIITLLPRKTKKYNKNCNLHYLALQPKSKSHLLFRTQNKSCHLTEQNTLLVCLFPVQT